MDRDRTFPRYGWHDAPMRTLLEDARDSGYRVTEFGRSETVHVQRGLWTAVKITPVREGTMVRKAYTTAQVLALGVALTLIALAVMAGP